MSAHCSSCKQKIYWAETEKRRRIPVDPYPVKGGNIVLVERPHLEPLAVYVKKDPDIAHFVSHFATCPNAAQHRKKP